MEENDEYQRFKYFDADKSENSNLCWLESFVHGIADKVTFTWARGSPNIMQQ